MLSRVDAEGGPFQLVDTDRRVPFRVPFLRSLLCGGLLMSVPEYFIGTVEAWLAPEDTVRPASLGPASRPVVAPWVRLGENRLTDEGVTWEVVQTINPERDLNAIFPGDAFRVEADEMVSFNLKEFTAEVISKALNNEAVDTTAAVAGVAGYRSVSVSGMGVAVAKMALLVRVNNAPYALAAGDAGPYISEFWAPSCYEASNFSTVLGSRAVSMVPFQFMCLLSNAPAHADDRMGSWRFQNADED